MTDIGAPRTMDLDSGCPYWLLHAEPPRPREPLARDLEADTVVIGAGVTGASCAYYLAVEGAGVMVLDRREPATGSTAAATALVQYEVDLGLGDLAERLGKEVAARAWLACRAALAEFERVAHALGDVGCRERPSLYLAASEADAAELAVEWRRRRAIGLEVEYLDRATLEREFGLSRPAALLTPDAAEVDPVRFTRALLREVEACGGAVYPGTDVVDIRTGAGGVVLRTRAGVVVRCRRLVLAAGYETAPYLPAGLLRLRTTYAVATAPLAARPPWPRAALIWETARPYFYCRTLGDGGIMMGGEDADFVEPAARDAMIATSARRLIARLRTLLPDVAAEPSCAWAGVFAESADSLPYVGALPRYPGIEFALAYGANGILFSIIAGRIVRDRILGRPNPEAALFGFERAGSPVTRRGPGAP